LERLMPVSSRGTGALAVPGGTDAQEDLPLDPLVERVFLAEVPPVRRFSSPPLTLRTRGLGRAPSGHP
jgi:hypothetical protein